MSNTPKSTELLNIQPLKAHEYAKYCVWKNIPAFFRNPPTDKKGNKPTPLEFAQAMGIEDDELLELVQIPTQGAFGEKYNVHIDTLSDWNRTPGVRGGLDEARVWAKGLTKNVIFALYNHCIRTAYAPEVKLFMQLVENWKENSTVDVKHHVAEVIYDVVPNKKIEHADATTGR